MRKGYTTHNKGPKQTRATTYACIAPSGYTACRAANVGALVMVKCKATC